MSSSFAGADGNGRPPRVLIGCVGNLLRGDDGFGPAVAARLSPSLPAGAHVVETGIGGIALLQEIMTGIDGLIVVDAIDEGEEPGTVLLMEPEIGEAVHVPDVHLANPERVLNVAKGIGALPDRVRIVGCQVEDADKVGEGLTPAVERAVPVAAAKVEELARAWLEEVAGAAV
ncbi:MAG: hydrogenase maturation protease [Actinomycetota bacterium]|nr:hydrogenase maturation protease [Actinomycetota bacterium]